MRHSLPKDPHLRAVWLERIGLSESAAPRSVRVCGRHFPPEAYHYNLEFVQRSAVGMKHLHLKRIPCRLCYFPKHGPARCSSPRLVDEATQGTRGQDMSGDTTLASEGDEMCQTDDPTYDPSDFSLDADFPLGATFSRCLEKLLVHCRACLRELPILRKCTHKFTVTGTQLEVVSLCSVAHSTTWESQPSVGGNPAGNLLLASGIFFAGCLAAPVLRLLASINIQIFTERTFYNYQRAYLVPAVNEVFQEHESRLIDDLAGTEVELAASRAFAALKGIVESPSLLRDLTQIAPAAPDLLSGIVPQRAIHFCPKVECFHSRGDESQDSARLCSTSTRTRQREQAETQDGIKRYKIKSSKSRKGHYTTCPVKEDRSYSKCQ
ncbi:hypothetical protein HPB48_010332 [Haemaphysalis longicornis]|uniref:THAP-type domain-containing protein n=1 Tax=Haemaphysalis longicornis TaxID=44386 RepID=A0A9J6FZE1_HAELO|nr:hypothetical protein HPB48_010332 [Haemaphysalis longicornis]